MVHFQTKISEEILTAYFYVCTIYMSQYIQGQKYLCTLLLLQIGEHLSLLREGYHGPNPFPFVAEMKLVEETEQTLGYTPELHPLVQTAKLQYWSTAATTFLLSLLTHYCQENFSINSPSLFPTVSMDMEHYGYW